MPEIGNRGTGDYALADDVAWLKAEDGSSRLFDIDRSSYGLNESATRMLDGILNGTKDETAENLAREFQIDQPTIKFDLAELLSQLAASRLIVPAGAERSKDWNILHPVIGGTCHLIFSHIIPRFRTIQTEASLMLSVLRMGLRFLSLSKMVAILDRSLPADHPTAHGAQDRVLDEVESTIVSSVRELPLETACKERALCCWFMLRRRGIPAEVVVGVTLNPVSGHSWCQVGQRIIGDTVERCCDFTVIWRH